MVLPLWSWCCVCAQVGEIKSVAAEQVETALSAGTIPVLTSLGLSA